MSIFNELRRRRVFRLAGLYLIGAWLVLQIADVIVEPMGFPDWAMTVLVWTIIVGFFVATALSWRYDLGKDGLVRVRPAAADSTEAAPLSSLDYLILGCSVVVAGLLSLALVKWFWEQDPGFAYPDPAARQNAVAVLPFTNFTDDDELGYYGDGVAEEVTNHLSLVDGLSVLAFNISLRFRGAIVDPRDVADELGVRYVVSGSLRKAGGKLRVSAALVAAVSGVQLWSMTEETTPLDAFAVQNRITDGVVAAIRSELNIEGDAAPAFSETPPDPEAYDLYLKGRSIWSRRGAEDLRAAVDLLRESVRVDPEFARGWSALASAYLVWPGYSPEGYGTWRLAQDAARKALELDDSLAEPRAVLAVFETSARRWAQADRLYEEALGIDPGNATINYWFSEHLAKTGRYTDSIEHLARARVLDPTYAPTFVDSIFVLALYGRLGDATRLFESVWQDGIRTPVSMLAGFITNTLSGNYERARALVGTMSIPDEHKRVMLRFVDVEAGIIDARSLIDQLKADETAWPDYVTFVWLTARLGANDLALKTMRQRLASGGSIETRMLWGPRHRLLEDPDFADLIDEIGLVRYWKTTALSDFCNFDGLSVTCTAPQAGDAPDSLARLVETLAY